MWRFRTRVLINITSNCANLGDNLWITPLFKNGVKGSVTFSDTPRTRSIARIFDGLADVDFVPLVENVQKSADETHEAQRILNCWDRTDVNCIPEIKITKEEIEGAQAFLSPYKNPIVVIADNSGSSDPKNYRASVVRPPIPYMQYLCDQAAKRYTPLQFGLSPNYYGQGISNFTKLNGTVEIRGLPLRQLAACYHVCGKYIGGDTGDYHLMLSVGGKAMVSIPHECRGYQYRRLLYTEELWKGEPVRVKYFLHRSNKVADLLDFTF